MDIAEMIKLLAGNETHNDIKIYQGEVTGYNVEERIAFVTTISGPEIKLETSFMTEPADGLMLIPKVGSIVYVMVNPTINPFIILYGDLEGIVIDCNSSILLRTNLINLNGDEYGGLIKISELTLKLNILEESLNTLINAFNTHIHPVVGANTGPASIIDTDVIELTKIDDLENKDVTHGASK